MHLHTMRTACRLEKTLLALLLAVLLVAGSCGTSTSGSKPKDSLVISVGGMTSGGFDPINGYGSSGVNLFQTCLLKINADVEVEFDLASGYEISEDRLTYTFTVRNDIKFSDGTSLTPQDVVFTYMTAKTAGSSVDLTMLERAEVLDGNKVCFTLNRVYSPFIRQTALLGIVPEHAWSDAYANNPIGTGPFVVKQLDVGQQLIVEPNPYYYGVKSPFTQITFLSLDEEVALSYAKSGQLDVVMVNPEYAKEEVPGMHLVTLKTSDNRGFNLPSISPVKNAAGETVGNAVTCDLAVRKALNIGISRQRIIDSALNGIGTPAKTYFSGMPWEQSEPAWQDGQVDEAIRILEEAGWVLGEDGVREKDGLKCEFTITGRTDDLQRYSLALALADEAKPLGIKIDAQAMDWTSAQKIVRSVGTCIGTGSYTYLDVYRAYISRNGSVDATGLSGSTLYQSSVTDAYLEKMLASKDDDEAIYWAKTAQYDGTDGPTAQFLYVWLVNIDHCYFVRDGLDLGVQRIHPHGHGLPVIQNMNEWKFTK